MPCKICILCSARVNSFMKVDSFYSFPLCSPMHILCTDISVDFRRLYLQFIRLYISLSVETALGFVIVWKRLQPKKLIDRLSIFPSRFRRHTPYYTHPDVRIYELNRRLQHRIEVCIYTYGLRF